MAYKKTGRAWRGPSGMLWEEVENLSDDGYIKLLPELRSGRSDQAVVVTQRFLDDLGWEEVCRESTTKS